MGFVLNAQDASKGDNYFFQYDYQAAIGAYEAQLAEDTLSLKQTLNLAESYFSIKEFSKAADTYVEVVRKDSLMSDYHFNRFLQSISKSKNPERLDAYLRTKLHVLKAELMENKEFNEQLLKSDVTPGDYEIYNLEINSSVADFSPAFYPSGLLFSTSKKGIVKKAKKSQPVEEGFLNVHLGNIEKNGQVKDARPFDKLAVSNFHKATPFYSDKLKGIFYILSNTENGEMAFDDNGKNALAMALQKEGGNFRLLLKDLSTSFYYPYYDAASEKLYFAANFKDSYGGTDLYYVHTSQGQIMSAPINMGPRINTPGNEIAPFIFENSLYFSSDVFYGLGGMDIYRSNMEKQEMYSIPVNLGKGINSPKDDFGFIIRKENDNLRGYFSSNREGGKGNDDIYGFKVSQKPGLKTFTLRGSVVKTERSSPVEAAFVRLFDKNGKMLTESVTDKDGKYRLEIPWVDGVVVEAAKARHTRYIYALEKDDMEGLAQEDFDIGLTLYDNGVRKREGQTVVKLDKFYFSRGAAQLSQQAKTELDKVVSFVKGFPKAQLRIETYTDSRGSTNKNLLLTQNRSDAIKKYLIANGVSSANIPASVGYGEQKILNTCKNGVYCLELLHRQNQRSLIVILNEDNLFD